MVTMSFDQTSTTAQMVPAKTILALVHALDILASNAKIDTERVAVAVVTK
jgi:hypothetical protein